MGNADKEKEKDEQTMREHWLSDLAPLSDAAQELFSVNEVPMSEEETAELLDEAEFRFPKNKPIGESEDAIIQEALVLGGPVGADQDPDAPQLSEEKMQILLGEVRKQLSTPSVESTPRKTRKIIPFKPILSTLGLAAAVMLGFFIFKGDPSVDSDTVAQGEIDVMPKGGGILLAFNGKAQVSEMEGDKKMDFRTLEDGDLLAPGMELKTGAEGEAVLLLTNGSLATLGPDSQMRLAEFTQEAFEGTEEKVSDLAEELSESHVLLELDLGELVVEVKKLDKQSSFDLYSPLGFAGIRGTQYRVLATDRSVRLSVLEGKVAVSKERGGLDHLIESERAILLEEDLLKEPDVATVEEIERIKRVNERARKLAEKIKLKDLAEAYDEINKRLALAIKEKELEQAMNKAIDEGTYIVESAANMEMIWCKPGTFMMGPKGSPSSKSVTLTKGFFLGKYEVTQEEYQLIMDKNPSKGKNTKSPVNSVSWKSAFAFCNKLNEKEKKRIPEGWAYTLPTEAEWEYACRAGTNTKYHWGDTFDSELANARGGGGIKTVGEYPSNLWGFYDLHGNVWEFCYDRRGPYPPDLTVDPLNLEIGTVRVIRGGAFNNTPDRLTVTSRKTLFPQKMSFGFRLCLKKITDLEKLENYRFEVNQFPGLVRHWKFDNQEANVSKANVGGFDAKLMGGAKLVPGKIGNAVEVDGERGYVDFGMGAGDTDGNFTVSFFVKYLGKDPPENYPKLMTNKKSFNGDDGWHFHLMSKREKWGAGSMWVRGSSGKGFGKKVNDDWKAGNWHHLLVSFEGENVTIYSDGKSRGTGKVTPVVNGLRNFTFSTKLKGYGFHGQLDDLRIYDRILTESEIMDIYEMGEFASKLAIVETKDDPKTGLALLEEKFEEAMNKPVGEGIHIVESAANMEMIWCKPGNFVMGDGSKVEGPKDKRSGKQGPPHQVFLSKGFYLGKYEVTQEEFEKIMGKNPSNFKGKKLPVERVTWSDAVAFCEALTKNEKMNGWMFSLPTEAQWEYACRAGTNTKYSWGDNINPKMANYKDSGLNKTVLVGSYQSNPWGLFDMHGNVFEWCADWYGSYRTGSLTDPMGPVSPVHFSQLGSLRVIRGGAWFRVGNSALSAHREYRNPEKYKYYDLGFRVCLQARKDG